MSTKTDAIEQGITDKIIAILESGDVPPWQKPWKTGAGMTGLPCNHTTGTAYRGMNTINLWLEATFKEYTSNAWMTYKQGAKIGAQVRRGEKGTPSVYVKIVKKEDERYPGKLRRVFMPCPFTVFNIDQFDGLERKDLDEQAEIDVMQLIPYEYQGCKLHDVVRDAVEKTGLSVDHGGSQAFYQPSTDHLQMPAGFPERGDYAGFAGVLSHELIHSTGHEKRLDRFARTEARKDVGLRQQYHYEELVAELGAAFLCAELGLPVEFDRRAAYLQMWLKGFKSDPKFLPNAAGDASRAARYLAAGSTLPNYGERKDQVPAEAVA